MSPGWRIGVDRRTGKTEAMRGLVATGEVALR
jgi:hypothetical protein